MSTTSSIRKFLFLVFFLASFLSANASSNGRTKAFTGLQVECRELMSLLGEAEEGSFRARAEAARTFGELINMKMIRVQLERLTGERALPGGYILNDRYSEESTVAVRSYIADRMRLLGHEVYEEEFKFHNLKAGNIIVEIPGTEDTKNVVELSAHVDTIRDFAPGADDNGTGVALLMEMARIFKYNKPKRSVRLVFSDLEESESEGLEHHLKEIGESKKDIYAALVVDQIGFFPMAHDFYFVLEAGDAHKHKKMGAYRKSRRLARELQLMFGLFTNGEVDVRVRLDNASPGSADHGMYWKNSIPALLFAGPDGDDRNAAYHTERDTIDKLNFEYYESVARMYASAAVYLSGVILHPQAEDYASGRLEDETTAPAIVSEKADQFDPEESGSDSEIGSDGESASSEGVPKITSIKDVGSKQLRGFLKSVAPENIIIVKSDYEALVLVRTDDEVKGYFKKDLQRLKDGSANWKLIHEDDVHSRSYVEFLGDGSVSRQTWLRKAKSVLRRSSWRVTEEDQFEPRRPLEEWDEGESEDGTRKRKPATKRFVGDSDLEFDETLGGIL